MSVRDAYTQFADQAGEEDLQPAGEFVEQLSKHCAQTINKVKELPEWTPCRDTVLNVLNRCLSLCEAFSHLYLHASNSHRETATEILNQ